MMSRHQPDRQFLLGYRMVTFALAAFSGWLIWMTLKELRAWLATFPAFIFRSLRWLVTNNFCSLDADAPLVDLLPSLLLRISASIANTVGSWLAAGFVHGVLNTDNFNVTGESFDYGPWRFLPRFDPTLIAVFPTRQGVMPTADNPMRRCGRFAD